MFSGDNIVCPCMGMGYYRWAVMNWRECCVPVYGHGLLSVGSDALMNWRECFYVAESR